MSTTTTPKAKTHLADLHFDHMEWLNSLQFYKEEFSIFERRLEEIVRRNNKHEVLAELEQFQNQFIREKEVIDELRHDIKVHENFLAKESKEHPVAIDHRQFGDHKVLRDRFHTFEKIHGELRAEFRKWLAQRM